MWDQRSAVLSERELAVCSGALDTSLRCLVARKRIMTSVFLAHTWFFFLSWRLETRLVTTWHESRDNFSAPESCFVFIVFAFKIKVSIILKIMQWNYKLTKQNWMVFGLATVLPIQQVWILKFVFGPEKFPGLSRNGPQALATSQVLM